jgi:uncharacterized membrane protein YphA (DoxX/SURF4 family)
MNTTLWIVQGILAFMFLMVGAMKIMQPYDKFKAMMSWAEDFSPGKIKMIGMLEILGALGIVLPLALGLYTFMTPLAALGLSFLMMGASATHLRRKEPKMLAMNVMLLMMALFVAYGRYFL